MKLPYILEVVQKAGYSIFTDGLFNLNIIGIRSKKNAPDAFDDWMVVAYKDAQGWVERWWPITTEPGLYYLQNKAKWYGPEGVAVLVPGQYRSVYKIDMHAGKYEALCQRNGAVRLYRDANLDTIVDYNPATVISSSASGINIHASTSTPYDGDVTQTKIGPWSAGCQVFASEADFRAFMELCKKQFAVRGWKTFTYTLILEP